MSVEQCDIHKWVEMNGSPAERDFRKAVHIILNTIASDQNLQTNMIMKGGILLAIRYQSTRFTRDIDFSTDGKYQDFDEDYFISKFRESLALACERLDYGIDCRVQSYKMKPSNNPRALFPTLKLRIGYADRSNTRSISRLNALKSTEVVEVDYSFNEVTQDIEEIHLVEGVSISAYSFADLIAEKFRAILQQEKRNRIRRQDVYDLYHLLMEYLDISHEEKLKIYESLLIKSESRDLNIGAESMRNPEIIERSRHDYYLLQNEIEGDLPNFDEAYNKVTDFYESLPWPSGDNGSIAS